MFGFFRRKQSENAGAPDQGKLVRIGTVADQLNREGAFGDAIKAYESLIDIMRESRRVDACLLGKAVLGILTAHVRAGQVEKAHAVWTLEPSSGDLRAIGIYALEKTAGQFDVQDIFSYYLICAYLHACAASSGEKAVEHYLNALSDIAIGERPEWKSVVSNHWLIDSLILGNFRLSDEVTKRLESHYSRLGKPDEAAILSLVAQGPDFVSFNQKGLARFFPDQAEWTRADGGVAFHPDGSVKAG